MDAVTTTARQDDNGGVIIENGVARLTGSDARSWTVETEEGEVTATIDEFTPFPGPHPPGAVVLVADNLIRNNGDVAGQINMEFAEVDTGGNVVRSICSTSTNLNQNGTGGLTNDPNASPSCQFMSSQGQLSDQMPDQFGETIHYGFRVWGETENQPGFPAPAATGAPQVQTGPQNAVDDIINDISNQLGVEPEIVVGSGVVVGGLTAGFIVEETFDVL